MGKVQDLKNLTCFLLLIPLLWDLFYFRALNYSWEIIITGLQSVTAEYTDDSQTLPRHTNLEKSDMKLEQGKTPFTSLHSAVLTRPGKSSTLTLLNTKTKQNMRIRKRWTWGIEPSDCPYSMVKLTITWCPNLELLSQKQRSLL